MTSSHGRTTVSRRTALTGLGAGGLAVALGTRSVQGQGALSTANHPLTGMWLAMANPANAQNPPFAAPSLFAADGTVVLSFIPADIGMDDKLLFQGSPMGVWEPYDERTGHFTAVQALADATGKLVGSVTIDGHPKVSEDGLTFIDDGSLVTITIRDAAGKVVTVVPPGTPGRPVTATKMRVGNAGFPGDEMATPTP